jgi:hypothetical protein
MSLGGGGSSGGYTSFPGVTKPPTIPTSGLPIWGGPMGEWGAPMGGGGTSTPPVDYSNFDFANLDLPQWGGAYSAPMTGGQLDALQGFNSFAQYNPVAQTLNQMGQTGGTVQDLGNMFKPYGTGYESLSAITAGPGGIPMPSDVSGVQNVAANIAYGGQNKQSDFSVPMNWLQTMMHGSDVSPMFGGATQGLANQLVGTDVGNTNMTGAQDTLGQAIGAAQTGVDVSPITSFINNSLYNAPTASHAGSSGFLNNLFASGGTNQQTSDLTNMLTGQLGQSFNERFDLSPMFTQAENVFNSSLDRNLARVREEYSGLGMAPGSSDRIDALGRTVGDATSQFQLGLQDLARQSFESSADRRLQGINTGMNLSNLTQLPQNTLLSALPAFMQSESLPFQEQMAVRDQQLSSLPTMLNAIRTNPELAQNASSLMMQASGLQGQFAQVPFAEQMAELAQKYGALNPMLGSEQLGLNSSQTGDQSRLQAAELFSSLIGQNTAEGQANTQNMLAALPMFMQSSTMPYEQMMQAYQNIINPGADRDLAASGALMNADQQAMAMALQAMNQQGDVYGQQFGLNEAARGIADTDLQRAMAEFARTQGGTLNQALSLFGMPGLNTGFGPSQLAQLGNMFGGIAGIAGAGMDLYSLFGGGRR